METAIKPKVRLRVRGMTRVISKIKKQGLSPFMLMRHDFESDAITKGFSLPTVIQALGERALNAYAVNYYIGQIRLAGSQLKKDVGGTKWEVELRDVTVEYL